MSFITEPSAHLVDVPNVVRVDLAPPCGAHYSLDALITLGAIRIWKATAIAYGENHRKTLRALNEARREAGNIIGKGLQ
jgi:hypothetical protein